MKKIDVHLSGSFISIMIIGGLCSFGVAAIVMWFSSACWPAVVDEEGITLRNKKRVSWNELTAIQPVRVVSPSGRRITGRLDLMFGKIAVKIVPQSIKEGQEVMDFISHILDTDIETG
ncbi:MAG: hypothetical protein ABRQ39_05570 [Candidatus Eremiobacterota bacterium]